MIRKTSEEWTREYGVQFSDYKGWPKETFHWSFYMEEISQAEFEERLLHSEATKDNNFLIKYTDVNNRKKTNRDTA